MKYLKLLLVLILALSSISLAYAQEQPWCGLQDIFYQHQFAVEPTGYETWINYPSGNESVDESITLTLPDQWYYIDAYISPQEEPQANEIRGGLRTYYMYAYVNNNAGTTILNSSLFIRDIYGNERYIYSTLSGDIDATVPTLYTIAFVRPEMITLNTTDRLVSKIYFKTTSPAGIIAHFVYQGNTTASFVRSGYFVCDVKSPPSGTGSEGLAIVFGVAGGLVGAVIVIRRLKK